MNKTNNTNTNTNNAPAIVNAIKALKPREALDKKAFASFYKDVKTLLDTVYAVYQSREKGKATPESESEAMTKVTAFLHTLGKVNGKYISVMEKTTENGVASVLFDTLVYNSFRDRIFTKSITLAKLEEEKAIASRKAREAHEALLTDKGSAKAYKEAEKAYKEAVNKVNEERAKTNAEGVLIERESINKFTRFLVFRLQAIIEARYALTKEEAEALRKIRNKEKKEAKKPAKKPAKTTEATDKKPA